jgi:ribosomal protein S6--L-glutamate ligase
VRPVIILTRHPDNHACSRFREARPQLDLRFLDPFTLELRLDTGTAQVWQAGRQLDVQQAAVVPRIGSTSPEYGLNVLEHLVESGAASINPPAGLLRLRHKFSMLSALACAGLPVPDSVMLRHQAGFDDAVQQLGGYPVVLKFVRGGQGIGVIKAQDADTIRTVLEGLNLLQYDALLQRFHPAAAESDTRVLVLGGRARWAIRRSSSGGRFRSNFHQGGSAVAVEINAELKGLAEAAAAVFGLGLAGVDIAEDGGKRYLLEVNSSPGFEATETAHAEDIAGAILDHAAGLGPE